MRTKYGSCGSIKTVNNQGQCGGCWAFSVTETLGDRFCSQLGVNVVLSAQDLLSCDDQGEDKGCNGGFTEDGFDFISDNGVKTASCAPFINETEGFCRTNCVSPSEAPTEYWCGFSQYIDSNITKIQAELFSHGSISAVFEVFEDFFQYKSGVYRHVTGSYAGLHAVTLMGWGTENGEDYWLVKNSWGYSFGLDGYFKIARGLEVNGCNFEGGLTAATPQKSGR
jgi:cathepsin B